MDGVALPSPGATHMPTGYQVLVIDPTGDITNPSSILANQYVPLFPTSGTNSWMSTYHYMYDRMVTTLLNAGNVDQQLIIVASYGMDSNIPPTNNFYAMLLSAGAGPRLQYWQTHCNPGSQVGNATSWVSFPANYIFVGYSSRTYGQGYEFFDNTTNPITSKLSVTLYNNVPPGPPSS
jgi:hypothetical protein